MIFYKCKEFSNVFFDDHGRFFTVKDGKDTPLKSQSTRTISYVVINGTHYNVLYLIMNALDILYTPYDRVTFKITKTGFISPKSINVLKSPEPTDEESFLIFKYKCDIKAASANGRFKDKISANTVLQILKLANFKCIYCIKDIQPDTWHLDHYIPKAHGGRNVLVNLAPACYRCNCMKGSMDGIHFLKRCAQIAGKNNMLSFQSKQRLNAGLNTHVKL